MNNRLHIFFSIILILSCTITHSYNSHPPKLTVILTIDQFAYHYINKLYPHLRHGLRYLLDNGVTYTNAHKPHGQPGTATGHAALNTGTYAKDHGYISNGWIDEEGNKTACDDDNSSSSRVISPVTGELYDYGKSAHLLLVDGITDQCVMQTNPHAPFRSFSISGKSRSAIATASRLGKAIWFDSNTGLFTSSKAFFDELPSWLHTFNQKNNIHDYSSIVWEKMYPKSPSAYNYFNTNNYEYSRTHQTMMGQKLSVPDMDNPKNPYHFFERSPQANQNLFNLSLECIKNNTSRKTKDRLLLWICLSPLDKLTHQYGPHSLEALDMIYHLDHQLKKFIRNTIRAVGKHQVAFVLTADHGIMPIPEIIHTTGLTTAQRIDQREFVQKLNDHLNSLYDLDGKNVVLNYKGQEIVFDFPLLRTLSSDKYDAIIESARTFALQYSFIKHAWNTKDLLKTPTQIGTLQDNIKNQIYPGRSGQIIIQPQPYSLITHWPQGTSHKSPYEYDTHVPLILFHRGKFERKWVRQRVTTLQLANTLAEMLNVPKPSASTAEILPDLFDSEYQ